MIWITLWKKLCALCSCKKETDTPMARDPRTVPPSEVHANRRPRVTSRRAYVDQLIARSSVLAALSPTPRFSNRSGEGGRVQCGEFI
jgi:hypothetical protein